MYSTQLLLIWLLISFSYPGIGNASVEGRAAKVTTLLLLQNVDLGYSPSILILTFALSRICSLCQPFHEGKERWRLADEKPHVR